MKLFLTKISPTLLLIIIVITYYFFFISCGGLPE